MIKRIRQWFIRRRVRQFIRNLPPYAVSTGVKDTCECDACFDVRPWQYWERS